MSESIFTAEELETMRAAGALPPTGLPTDAAARANELDRRTDALAQKAEALSDNVGQIPQHLLEPDREIQSDIEHGYMDIGANHPMFKTCWVNYVNINGQMVWKKKAEGWQVATAQEFPEAKHLMREDNTIRVGDVLLMFIRIDRYLALQQKQDELRRRQQFGLESEMHDLAAKHSKNFRVHTSQTGGLPQHLEQNMVKKAAQQTVTQHLGRGGTIPGLNR